MFFVDPTFVNLNVSLDIFVTPDGLDRIQTNLHKMCHKMWLVVNINISSKILLWDLACEWVTHYFILVEFKYLKYINLNRLHYRFGNLRMTLSWLRSLVWIKKIADEKESKHSRFFKSSNKDDINTSYELTNLFIKILLVWRTVLR